MRRFARLQTVRMRLLLAVVGVVAAALLVATVGFNLLLWRGLSNNADTLARSRAAVEASNVNVVDDRVEPSALPDRGGFESEAWTFVGGRLIDGPDASRALTRAAARAAQTPSRIIDVPREAARLFAQPAVLNGKQVAVVVVGVALKPYLSTKRIALFWSGLLAIVVLVTVTLVTRWVLAAALRPVTEMTVKADAWSVRDADRRFAVGEPRDELGQLAATLDSLLDRLSASLRREHRFSAELSHELRTPLAKVCAEAELALRRERTPGAYKEALQAVLGNAQAMTRTIDMLVAAQRQETGLARGSADSAAVLDELAVTCGVLAGKRGVELAVRASAASVPVGVESEVALRILQPIVEKACQCAEARVTLAVERNGNHVTFTVDDDGPGVRPSERELIFDPGVRGSDGDSHRSFPGAGLGLALSRRLARAASGEVTASTDLPGGHFVVRLPAG
jgi:two-component system, OmpR family, sensor kinase